MMHTTIARPSQQLNLGGLGELIQWGPLGPGGFPAASLQGTRGRGLGELIRWGELGPGGFPAMSLQGLGDSHSGAAAEATAGPVSVSGSITLPPWGILAYTLGGAALGYWAGRRMR